MDVQELVQLIKKSHELVSKVNAKIETVMDDEPNWFISKLEDFCAVAQELGIHAKHIVRDEDAYGPYPNRYSFHYDGVEIFCLTEEIL